jgi:hypothetical protein
LHGLPGWIRPGGFGVFHASMLSAGADSDPPRAGSEPELDKG